MRPGPRLVQVAAIPGTSLQLKPLHNGELPVWLTQAAGFPSIPGQCCIVNVCQLSCLVDSADCAHQLCVCVSWQPEESPLLQVSCSWSLLMLPKLSNRGFGRPLVI